MPNRRRSPSVTRTAPTRRSRMHRQASLTVALGGSVTGSWFLTMSDIFLMVRLYAGEAFFVRSISALPLVTGPPVLPRGLSFLSRSGQHEFSSHEYPRPRQIDSSPLRCDGRSLSLFPRKP